MKFFLCLLLFAASPLSAQLPEDTVEESRRWLFGSVKVEGRYDDNIMEYSPREIGEAGSGVRPTKYLVTDPADLAGEFTMRLDVIPPNDSPDYRTRIRFRYSVDYYNTNPIKDHHGWGFEVNQRISGRSYLAVRYDRLPTYYLRNLYYHRYRVLSRHPSHYDRADISRDAIAVEMGRNLSTSLRLALNYAYAKTQYASDFTERNSNLHAITLETDFRPTRPLRLSLDYTYSLRWARGRDNFSDPAYDSLADISSQYHQISAGAFYDLKRLVRLPVGVAARLRYERQGYLSGKTGDIYHFGRVDQLWIFHAQVDYGLFAAVELYAGYQWEQNRTNLGETGDAGNYQAHMVHSGVIFSF